MVKNSFPDLPTSEKLLAEELGQKVEEICTLKRDIDVPQLQVHAKRRRPTFLQDQCIAVSGRLAKVQKDILGEQVPSPVIFKQLLQADAIQFCQIDATRLAGVNDVLAVILLAAKHDIPVCPHGGGIGLCNMICHYALWDQIAVAAHSNTQVVEFINFLQEGVFLHPIEVADGAYVTPTRPGWSLDMHPDFIAAHTYPTGAVWRGREASGSIGFLA